MQININDISETALLMVLMHAQDATSDKPILRDQSAVEVLEAIRAADLDSTPQLRRLINKGRVDRTITTYINLRAKYYDDAVRDYLKVYPDATVVNIGCGLDGRFDRVDNGEMTMIDLDFSDIMDIKAGLFPPSARYLHIAQSVFDISWMDKVKSENVLLLAEGVFMYCNEEDVRQLFLDIEHRFPGAEMLCELYTKKYLHPALTELGYLFQRFKYGVGRDAIFKFGVNSGADLAKWSQGIKHLGDWSFLDSRHPKLGPLKFLRHINSVRLKIWTARYRF